MISHSKRQRTHNSELFTMKIENLMKNLKGKPQKILINLDCYEDLWTEIHLVLHMGLVELLNVKCKWIVEKLLSQKLENWWKTNQNICLEQVVLLVLLC